MTRIGFNFTLRSRKIATTKYAIMRKEILDIVRVMVPLKKNAEIIMVNPAFAIIETTAGRREPRVP